MSRSPGGSSRAGDQRQPGHRPQDQVGLIFAGGSSARDRGPRRAGSAPGHHRGRGPHSAYRLQAYENKAVPQGRQSAQNGTTINDSRDYGIGKRLHNLPVLRAAGFAATRRLLDVEKLSHDPADGQAAIAQITRPVITQTGTRVAGLRQGDSRVHALLAALCVFRLLPRGFANRDLRPNLAQLLGVPAESITPGKRLRPRRSRQRAPKLPTQIHRPIAAAPGVYRLHDRFLRTGLASLADPQTAAGTWPPPPAPTPPQSTTSNGKPDSPPDQTAP